MDDVCIQNERSDPVFRMANISYQKIKALSKDESILSIDLT